MNILILTGKFGMGHFSASQSLAQQLRGAFPGAEVGVEDLVAYTMPGLSEAMYKSFHLLVTYGSGIFNTFYKLTENAKPDVRPPLEGVFLDKLEELLEARHPDAVIATHPLCAQICSRWKVETGGDLPLVTCVTDLSAHSEWINQGTDCYLVGSREVRDALCTKGVERNKICVTGIPVRSEFRHSVRLSRDNRADGVRRLLIMGGGLGLLPRKDKFYEALNALPGVETTIIAGYNRRLYDRLAGKYEHVEVLGYTDRVYEYMSRSDLMLSKPGGITLFETIFSELPILAWEPFLEQEKKNARFLVRAGIGRIAAKEAGACLEVIRTLIYDDDALRAMAGNMRRMTGALEHESLSRIMSAAIGARGVCA